MIRKELISEREKRGLTRTEVADSVGITPQHLGMIERGERDPSYQVMNDLAEYYGRSAGALFFRGDRNDLSPSGATTEEGVSGANDDVAS